MTEPIPAADFDFSTIKEGDEVTIRFKVLADGLTHEYSNSDRFVQVKQPDFGPYFYRPSAFHSVILAPKPKTLRERAIEVLRNYVPEAQTEVVADAVLAEVEKGQ